jgi:hypothetical protein
MAKGAYYQGLKYSNQGVKPVDFGASALNFAKEYRYQKEKRDAFLMEQQEKYAEDFTLDQLNAGLSQPDAIGDEIQARLLAKFNAVNEAVNAQQMSLTEARALTNNYKGQLMSLKQSYDQMGDFVNKYNEMGPEGRGESMNLAMEHLNEFMNGASITEDKDGKMYISKVDENGVRSQPLANIKDLYEERKSVSVADDIAKPLFDIDNKASKAFVGNTAYNQFLEGGKKLSQTQKDAITDFFKERYDDRDLMDLAKQYDIDAPLDPNEFKLADRKALEQALLPKVQESIRDLYELRQYTEDNLSLEIADRKLKYNASKDYGTKDAKYRIRQFEDGSAVLNLKKPLTMQSIAAVAVQENQDSLETEKIFDDMYGPGGSGETTDPSMKYFDLSVNYVRISPSGRSLILNSNYTPEKEEEYVKGDGTRAVKKVRGTQQRGDLMMPIESIEAQRLLDRMGILDEHRNILSNPVRVTSRKAYGTPAGRASQFNTFNK